jgi:hypothetical protein
MANVSDDAIREAYDDIRNGNPSSPSLVFRAEIQVELMLLTVYNRQDGNELAAVGLRE